MKRLFNNQIKMIKSLQNKKGRDETGMFVIEGIKTVKELLLSDICVEFIVFDKNFDDIHREEYLNGKNFEIFEHNITSISSLSTSEGILAVAKKPEEKNIEEFFGNKSNLLGIFGINDPGNVGTLIRTAKWFSLDGVVLYENCVDAFSPKVIRSSMGAVFGTDIVKFNNYDESKKYLKNFYKVSTFLDEKHNYNQENRSRKILFLGNEANGLDVSLKKECDSNFRIEPVGGFESLNVSVAGGIIMNEIYNSHRGAKC